MSISINLDTEVYCDNCREELTIITDNYDNNIITLHVDACSCCIEAAKESMYDDAYQEGFDRAIEQIEAGEIEINDISSLDKEQIEDDAFNDGYKQGYQEGYETSCNDSFKGR